MIVDRETFDSIYHKVCMGELGTRDIYTAVAAHVLGIPAAEVTPEQRRVAKSASFVHLYGN
jgi:hypothetical protein